MEEEKNGGLTRMMDGLGFKLFMFHLSRKPSIGTHSMWISPRLFKSGHIDNAWKYGPQCPTTTRMATSDFWMWVVCGEVRNFIYFLKSKSLFCTF